MVPQLNRPRSMEDGARGALSEREAPRREARPSGQPGGADEDWRFDDDAPDLQDRREALPVVDGQHDVSVRKWFPS